MPQFDTETYFRKAYVQEELTMPDGTVGNTQFSSSSGERLGAAKAIRRQLLTYQVAAATVVPSTAEVMYISCGDGTIAGLDYSIEIAPGSSETVGIDLQVASDGSASYSSVLTAAVSIPDSVTVQTRASGSIQTSAYTKYDRFRLLITNSGSTAAGLVCNVLLNEDPA